MQSRLAAFGALALVSSTFALLPSAADAADGSCTTTNQTVTCTFASTGAEQVFTVPADVTSVSVAAVGAAGAEAVSLVEYRTPGGLGGTASTDLSVTPGQQLYVEVGGAPSGSGCYPNIACVGGFNGGGSSHFGGGGGGASDVRTIPRSDAGSLDSRLVVAAGGGGGGEGFATAGGVGGTAGQPGGGGLGADGYAGGSGGGAGTAAAGGTGGASGGGNGSQGAGGAGGGDTGGGGGGGLYGGGGGGNLGFDVATTDLLGAGGGGGGSSYAPGGSTGLAAAGQAPSVTISYQLTEPTITAALSSSTPRNAAGWWRAPVTVTFTCTPGSAPVSDCPAPVVLDQDGAGQSVTRTTSAADGGTASVTVGGIDLDQTAPGVRVGGPRSGATYLARSPQPRCAGTDALSGVASCRLSRSRVPFQDGWVYDDSARATDKAGNSAHASASFRVLRYGVAGTPLRNGAWQVRAGHFYDFVALAKHRPRLLGPAVGNATPRGGRVPFARAGRASGMKKWVLSVRITRAMAGHSTWTYGVRSPGAIAHLVKIRIVG